MEKIEINTEFIKLDQFLKFSSIAITGGMAKEMIADGLVCVNDAVCLERGKKLRDKDTVKVNLDEDIHEFIVVKATC